MVAGRRRVRGRDGRCRAAAREARRDGRPDGPGQWPGVVSVLVERRPISPVQRRRPRPARTRQSRGSPSGDGSQPAPARRRAPMAGSAGRLARPTCCAARRTTCAPRCIRTPVPAPGGPEQRAPRWECSRPTGVMTLVWQDEKLARDLGRSGRRPPVRLTDDRDGPLSRVVARRAVDLVPGATGRRAQDCSSCPRPAARRRWSVRNATVQSAVRERLGPAGCGCRARRRGLDRVHPGPRRRHGHPRRRLSAGRRRRNGTTPRVASRCPRTSSRIMSCCSTTGPIGRVYRNGRPAATRRSRSRTTTDAPWEIGLYRRRRPGRTRYARPVGRPRSSDRGCRGVPAARAHRRPTRARRRARSCRTRPCGSPTSGSSRAARSGVVFSRIDPGQRCPVGRAGRHARFPARRLTRGPRFPYPCGRCASRPGTSTRSRPGWRPSRSGSSAPSPTSC